MLSKLGHPQPPTPMKTDNSTALSFIKANIRQKRSKSWDMRYYCLRDRIAQQQFKHYWQPGTMNDADYFTKHHPPKYHVQQRKKFVHVPQELCALLSQVQHQQDGEGVLLPQGGYKFFPLADQLANGNGLRFPAVGEKFST